MNKISRDCIKYLLFQRQCVKYIDLGPYFYIRPTDIAVFKCKLGKVKTLKLKNN